MSDRTGDSCITGRVFRSPRDAHAQDRRRVQRVQWYYGTGTSVGFADAQTADPLRLGSMAARCILLLDIPDSATRRDIIETCPGGEA